MRGGEGRGQVSRRRTVCSSPLKSSGNPASISMAATSRQLENATTTVIARKFGITFTRPPNEGGGQGVVAPRSSAQETTVRCTHVCMCVLGLGRVDLNSGEFTY